MPARNKLYIDSEGVIRGHYVYLHKVRPTGEVFYVGKGSGRRAWETDGRNDKWKERVASLVSGWDVEIVQRDLSEIEAFELEAHLVEQYGGCAADGGRLTNWIPGGEDPISIQLGIQFDDGGWSAAYCEARTFKEFPRKDQEAFVAGLNRELDAILSKLEPLESEADDRDDEKLFDSVSDLDCILRSLHDVASDFLHRRVPWKDFALALEDALEDLESELEDIAKHHKKVKPLLKQACKVTPKCLLTIDSGNRKVAEDTATRLTGKEESC
jgi:hypothetical protein